MDPVVRRKLLVQSVCLPRSRSHSKPRGQRCSATDVRGQPRWSPIECATPRPGHPDGAPAKGSSSSPARPASPPRSALSRRRSRRHRRICQQLKRSRSPVVASKPPKIGTTPTTPHCCPSDRAQTTWTYAAGKLTAGNPEARPHGEWETTMTVAAGIVTGLSERRSDSRSGQRCETGFGHIRIQVGLAPQQRRDATLDLPQKT